jgi:predicted transcriptional regulator
MINFACKNFNLDEVIRCGLSLTRSDYNILRFLIKNKKEFSSEDISKKLKIDLTTAQRSLKKLREMEIILRRQVNLSSGGYIYFYSSKPKSFVKEMVLKIVNNWGKKVEEELENW